MPVHIYHVLCPGLLVVKMLYMVATWWNEIIYNLFTVAFYKQVSIKARYFASEVRYKYLHVGLPFTFQFSSFGLFQHSAQCNIEKFS